MNLRRVDPFTTLRCGAFSLVLLASGAAHSSGLFEDGASARSKGLGGISTAGAQGPLDALNTNPAELSNVRRPALEAGADLAWGEGEFANRANRNAEMSEFGAKPHGTLSYPLGPVTLGVGFIPDAALRDGWSFRDAPGGLDGGTSYGVREHFSELQVLRFALGGSYRVSETFSLGAGLGILYNRNILRAPYTIQSQPQLQGAKVLLDLDTEGWGANGVFGALWKPAPALQAGLSYTLGSRIRADGSAHANAGQQLANLGLKGVNAKADFDGEVTNNFPQIVSLALSWQATKRLTLLGQVDWTDYRDSFDSLDVRLKNVNNPLYRQLLAGGKDLNDRAPLNWRSQWSFRLGGEYELAEHWTARAGYRYANNPVPDSTLTPLTATIGEHLLAAGLGYHTGRYGVDLSFQWELPATARAGQSALLNGEYSDSRVTTEAQFLSLTTRVEF